MLKNPLTLFTRLAKKEISKINSFSKTSFIAQYPLKFKINLSIQYPFTGSHLKFKPLIAGLKKFVDNSKLHLNALTELALHLLNLRSSLLPVVNVNNYASIN